MIRSDLLDKEYSELVFRYIVAGLIIYKLTLDKVVVENEFTRKGFLTTTFTFHSLSPNCSPHKDCVRVFNQQYKTLLDFIASEFPNVDIIDLRQIKECY